MDLPPAAHVGRRAEGFEVEEDGMGRASLFAWPFPAEEEGEGALEEGGLKACGPLTPLAPLSPRERGGLK
jgi:hypothetical protein